jgi:hypothetical protein
MPPIVIKKKQLDDALLDRAVEGLKLLRGEYDETAPEPATETEASHGTDEPATP